MFIKMFNRFNNLIKNLNLVYVSTFNYHSHVKRLISLRFFCFFKQLTLNLIDTELLNAFILNVKHRFICFHYE